MFWLSLILLTPQAAVDPAYPWLADWAQKPARMQPLQTRFAAPEGFTRVKVAPDSFAAWLRNLPLDRDRDTVLAYDGRTLIRPAAAIVAMDVGRRDLQQCADSAIRLHAEYLWHRGLGHKARYHFTSGDRSTFRDWARGERFAVKGSKVKRIRGKRQRPHHQAYRQWLMHTFRYAGTRSLKFDSTAVGARPYAAGDFFVQPGGPGHAVMILDIAEDAAGRRVALMGQGFMPAEDFHVLRSPAGTVDGTWFTLPTTADPWIVTPSWAPFHRDHARRFKTPR